MSTGTLHRAGRSRHALPAPIDPRLQARRVEVARRQGRKRLRRLLAATVVTTVAAGAYGLTRSPLLDVDHVTLHGADGARRSAVSQAAGIEPGTAMTELSTDAVAGRVAALPWVRSVEVVRHWPATVAVTVTARTPVAVTPDGAGVDVEGLVIGPVAGSGDLPEVRIGAAEVGTVVDPEHLDLLEVLGELPDALRSEVASGATVEGEVVLTLVDGIRVRFGAAERLSAKYVAIEALLEQAGRSRIRALDVRVPTSPSLTPRVGTGA